MGPMRHNLLNACNLIPPICFPKSGKVTMSICTLLVSLLSVHSAAAQTSFEINFSRSVVTVGESLKLSLIFNNGRLEAKSLSNLPTLPGLQISYSIPSHQNKTVVGPRSSFKRVVSYPVRALRPGKYTYPPILCRMNGKTYRSRPATLTVVARDPRVAAQAKTEKYFSRILVEKEEVYPGELFLVEMQLLVQQGNRADLRQYPKVETPGFVFGEKATNSQTKLRQGNTIYQVFVIQRTAKAVKSGKLSLGPAVFTFQFGVRSGRSIFGTTYNNSTKIVPSDTRTIRVLDFPQENRPEHFQGAVGEFDFQFLQAAPKKVSEGDPITLQFRVFGKGSLDNISIHLDTEKEWKGFKIYDPETEIQLQSDLGMQGIKSFRQVVVPQNDTITSLPPLRFAFFDPKEKAFKSLGTQPISIEVMPQQGPNVMPTIAAPNNGTDSPPPPEPNDIVHIKPHFGSVLPMNSWQSNPSRLIQIQLIPLIGWIALLLRRKYRERIERNPALLRKKKSWKEAEENLNELRRLTSAQQSNDFFSLLFRTLQELLGAELELPSSAITDEAIEDCVTKTDMPESLAGDLSSLFEACNQANYSPFHSTEELQQATGKTAKLLEFLSNRK